MSTAYFDFSPELNYFLKRGDRDRQVVLEFKGDQSVKHLIESVGIPHTEIGDIRVNGQGQKQGYLTRDGDRIEVQAAPMGCPQEPRFLLDGHLGRLAAYLRMLGFDCSYQADTQDEQLALLARQESRILLTRDRRLLMRKIVTWGYCLRSLEPQEQLVEVVRRYGLAGRTTPFRRCLRCNHPLEPVSKSAVLDRLKPLTRQYFEEFSICPACDQIYWKGSHYDRMQHLIARCLSN